MEKKFITIGFEGSHRVGKGTQIELLKNKLETLGIPTFVVRGAGSRENSSKHLGDPYSRWWDNHLELIRGSNSTKGDWFEATKRLARELLYFKQKLFPKFLNEKGKKYGFILVDRNIMSHLAMVDEEDKKQFEDSHIFGKYSSNGRKIPNSSEILPDLIFFLDTSIDVLLSRLDPNDPKYEFRMKNIIENTIKFKQVYEELPETLKEKIIVIDANQSMENLQKQIFSKINDIILKYE